MAGKLLSSRAASCADFLLQVPDNQFGFIWVWWVWPCHRARLHFALRAHWDTNPPCCLSGVTRAAALGRGCKSILADLSLAFTTLPYSNSFSEGNTFIYTSWSQFSTLWWCWGFCTSAHAKTDMGFVVTMGKEHGSVGTLQQECCTQLCPNACKN